MTSLVNPTLPYLRERFNLFPWLAMPVVLFFIGHGPVGFRCTLLLSLVFAVFFFRVFDDYFCYDYDRKTKKKSIYLKNGSGHLLTGCLSVCDRS